MIPGLSGGDFSWFMILQTIMTVLFVGLLFFFPKLMMWQTNRKLGYAMEELEAHKNDAETMFLAKFVENPSKSTLAKFDSLKDFKLSAPSAIDPAGMVGKLEHVLDSSEDKFRRFIRNNADTEDEDEMANLGMAFKGVMGTHQIFKTLRHFRILINKTKTLQLISLVNMMLPIYKELAESQKAATRAFVDEAPIGDAIGPLVAAKLIQSEPEEIAEDIIHSKEELNEEQDLHVLKSEGPGARLGKYGDAIDTVAEENDLDAIITVDAAAKFEGEETGSVAEGVGVMMGGPGVEKSKIEEAATEHDVPLEGIVIKQSPPEASKPMKKEIYESYHEAVDKVKEVAEEFDNDVALVGVGNTCGVGNRREEVTSVHTRLQKYWEEYEEQEEEEVSYMGLMSAMPGGNEQLELRDKADRLLLRLPRR